MPHVPGSVSGPLFRNWWCSFTSPHYDRIYISHSVCLCVRGGFRIPSLLSMQAISVCLIYHRIATNFTSMGSMGNGGWSIHRTHVRQHLEPTSVATNWSRWNMIEFKFHQSPFSIWPHGFVQSDQNGSTPKFKRLCLSVFPNCKKKGMSFWVISDWTYATHTVHIYCTAFLDKAMYLLWSNRCGLPQGQRLRWIRGWCFRGRGGVWQSRFTNPPYVISHRMHLGLGPGPNCLLS